MLTFLGRARPGCYSGVSVFYYARSVSPSSLPHIRESVRSVTFTVVKVNPAIQSHGMDTPLATSLFRQLFRHRPRVRNARLLPRNPVVPRRQQQQCRTIFSERDDAKVAAAAGEWQPKSPFLQIDMTEEFRRYPMVTAEQLSKRKERPRRVKMLVRDYIDGCLPLQPFHPSTFAW